MDSKEPDLPIKGKKRRRDGRGAMRSDLTNRYRRLSRPKRPQRRRARRCRR